MAGCISNFVSNILLMQIFTLLYLHCQITLRLLMSYKGCPRRNVKYFGRVFLELNYTDIAQNTYIQS